MGTLQRYDGRDLGTGPHIAVLGSCKVGNFVVTIPLLLALRRHYPQARLDFWGSEATRDFEEALVAEGLLSWRTSWDLADPVHFQALATAAPARVAGAHRAGAAADRAALGGAAV